MARRTPAVPRPAAERHCRRSGGDDDERPRHGGGDQYTTRRRAGGRTRARPSRPRVGQLPRQANQDRVRVGDAESGPPPVSQPPGDRPGQPDQSAERGDRDHAPDGQRLTDIAGDRPPRRPRWLRPGPGRPSPGSPGGTIGRVGGSPPAMARSVSTSAASPGDRGDARPGTNAAPTFHSATPRGRWGSRSTSVASGRGVAWRCPSPMEADRR